MTDQTYNFHFQNGYYDLKLFKKRPNFDQNRKILIKMFQIRFMYTFLNKTLSQILHFCKDIEIKTIGPQESDASDSILRKSRCK